MRQLSNDLEQPHRFFWIGWIGPDRFRLCCLTLVVQAAFLDGLLFNAPPFSQNGFAAPEIDVSRGQVADALVVAVAVVVIDEGGDGGFEFTLHELVFQ